MGETKSRSIRVDDEVWADFCGRMGTQNEVMRGLLSGGEQKNAGISELTGRMDLLVKLVNEHLVDPVGEILELCRSTGSGNWVSEAASALVASAVQPQVSFSIVCKHCGNAGRGSTKFATICIECKGSGHTNQPAECPVCTGGSGI